MPEYLPDRYNPQMLTDEGYLETEDILFELTAELESIYGQAYSEMLAKCKKYLAWFVAMDLAKRKRFEAGEIDLDEYKRWRMTNMLTGENHYQMLDVLSTDLTNVNLIAASVINNYMPEVYAVNTNWTEYSIEKVLQVETSFSLFDESTVERLVRDKPDLLPKASVDIPKDKQWNKNKINSAITQGILQGETIDEIAVRLADVTDMNKNSAVRNAATMTTSAQNGGRNDTIKRAEGMGIAIKKRWLATLDGHTRPTHRICDGEEREIGKYFSNGLEFPGDPKGKPAEVYNCRCCLVSVVDKQKTELSDRDTRELERWEMSYDEWKELKGQGKQPITRAARNVNRDLKMHEEYMSLLGKRVPSRFKDFQEIKYKHPEQWHKMVSDARKARNKRKKAV
jgi:hypothetical protein